VHKYIIKMSMIYQQVFWNLLTQKQQ